MKERDELELILKLIGKYSLPLSPILEYAIKEKMEEYPTDEQPNTIDNDKITASKTIVQDKQTITGTPVDISSNDLRVVDYGEHTIAVIGDTKPHKDVLKALGGYFILRTQWGAAWIFSNKKRKSVQAYIDGNICVVENLNEQNQKDSRNRSSERYLIRVKYPNGKEFCSKHVWETLVDVVKYAGPERVMKLDIYCMGDSLVSPRLNENPRYRVSQKEIGKGLYVCTYSSTETKLMQIEKINEGLNLGLNVEKVFAEINDSKEEPKISEKENKGERDRSKYSFNGGPMLNKRRFVLEVVKYYVRTHPNVSYGELLEVFPPSLHRSMLNGVFRGYYDVMRRSESNPDILNRFFVKENELITLSNGMKITVHNQWGESFEKFLEVAKKLYAVTSSTDTEDDYYSLKFPTPSNGCRI